CAKAYVEGRHYYSPDLQDPSVFDHPQWFREYPYRSVATHIYAIAEERNSRLRRRRRIELPGFSAVPSRPIGGTCEETDRISNPPLATEVARAAQTQIDSYVKLNQPAAAESVLDQLAATNLAPT